MATGTVSPVAASYADSSAHGVVIADGYGISISVKSGHLHISDGIGRARRERRIPRVPRTMQRLVILGSTGMITTEAIRWLDDAGISWVHLAHDGRTIAISGPQTQDARLLRAQSRAYMDGDLAAVGQEITRYLLGVKLAGQADNVSRYFGAESAASIIRQHAGSLHSTDSPNSAEGRAAECYWSVWSGRVAVPWSPMDMTKVPANWYGFTQRPNLHGTQPINGNATDPVNACLNFAYKLGEVACVHACHMFGLHPALGISHTDKANRDSLALDILEAIRPALDRIVLDRMAPDGAIPYHHGKPAYFDRRWVHENPDGSVRLVAPLTHSIASHAAELSEAIEPHAHKLAKMLADAGSGIITVKRPVKSSRATGIHRGTATARLRPGVTIAQVIPDELWRQIEPIIPPRPREGANGRTPAMPAREIIACAILRYSLGVGWSDIPAYKRIVNVWRDHLVKSGAWPKVESLVKDAGHLAALVA